MLATGAVVVSADPRVSVQAGRDQTTLVINRITEQDAGEYVCQASSCTALLLWSMTRVKSKQSTPVLVNVYLYLVDKLIFAKFQISILNDILSVRHSLDVLGMTAGLSFPQPTSPTYPILEISTFLITKLSKSLNITCNKDVRAVSVSLPDRVDSAGSDQSYRSLENNQTPLIYYEISIITDLTFALFPKFIRSF